MRKGSYILSGGGDPPISHDVDKVFLSKLEKNSRILYIPVALRRNRQGYEECLNWFTGLLQRHKRKDLRTCMLTPWNKKLPNLSGFSSLFIGGGNTFRLLHYIVKWDLHKHIPNYVESGGHVYGGSAGAIVLGKDIRTVEQENKKNYPEYQGIGCVGEYSLICHYEQSNDEEILKAHKKINTPIIAIPEDGGIIVNSEKKIIKTINKVFVIQDNVKDILK